LPWGAGVGPNFSAWGLTAPKEVILKAALHSAYGPADLLHVLEVEKPVPKEHQVLIKIRASTVSSGDCNVRNFTFVPKSMAPIAKLMFGVGKPWRKRILGTQLAGEVEAVGPNVTRFKAGGPRLRINRHRRRRTCSVRLHARRRLPRNQTGASELGGGGGHSIWRKHSRCTTSGIWGRSKPARSY
jgi:D-arabinose 1-dehydrogenase-like Zn-dependent alcohol dehydrogenase